jgi:hypothetical protein
MHVSNLTSHSSKTASSSSREIVSDTLIKPAKSSQSSPNFSPVSAVFEFSKKARVGGGEIGLKRRLKCLFHSLRPQIGEIYTRCVMACRAAIQHNSSGYLNDEFGLSPEESWSRNSLRQNEIHLGEFG